MTESTSTCPSCGSPVPSGARFCANCGHIIDSPTVQPEVERLTQQTTPQPLSDESEQAAAIEMPVVGVTDAPPAPEPAMADEPEVPTQPANTGSWYASLAASPGEQPVEDSAETENNSGYTPPRAPGEPAYTSPPVWQPGQYDAGSTRPVQLPPIEQTPPLPPYNDAPLGSQPQSIFAPPTPQAPQGQYTSPLQQQGYTPPPAYNYNAAPTQNISPGATGTQPLPSGQPYQNPPQYQPGYPYPPQAQAVVKDPTTALMLELLGYLGFLGIGHIYAGKTNRGIGLLIGWLLYLVASFILTFCLVGCFMFLAWLFVPPISGVWVKNEMEKERAMGMRQ